MQGHRGGLSRELAEAVSPEQQERNRDAFVLCRADAIFVRLLSATLPDVPRPRAPAPSISHVPTTRPLQSTASQTRERAGRGRGHLSQPIVSTLSWQGHASAALDGGANVALQRQSGQTHSFGTSTGISWPSRYSTEACASGQEAPQAAPSALECGFRSRGSSAGRPRDARPDESTAQQSMALSGQTSGAEGRASELVRDVTVGLRRDVTASLVAGLLLEGGREVHGLPGRVELSGSGWALRISEARDRAGARGGPAAGRGLREERLLWRIHEECLAALRELCYSSPTVASSLACHRGLLLQLFHFMEHAPTFDLGGCPGPPLVPVPVPPSASALSPLNPLRPALSTLSPLSSALCCLSALLPFLLPVPLCPPLDLSLVHPPTMPGLYAEPV